MRWRSIAAVALVSVGVGAAVIAVVGPSVGRSDATQYITATAARADVTDAVSADGSVSATTTYGLQFGSDPRLVTQVSGAAGATAGGASDGWLVADVATSMGQQVKAGDVLATADTSDAELALSSAQAQYDAAVARYAADRAGASKAEKTSAKDQVRSAEQSLANARRSRSQTSNQNAVKVAQARRAVTRAQKQYDKDRAADAPSSVLAQDKNALVQAKDNLQLTKAQASAANQQASDQVSTASVQLSAARNTYGSRTSKAGADILASDRASIAQAKQQLADAQARLDAAILRAPVDGTVTAVDIVEGALAPSGDAIELMAGLEVTASFAESDLPSLVVGQPVDVSISATGDDVTGAVTRVDPVASTGGTSSVVSYAVTIGLNDVPQGILQGMTASVSVATAEVKDALSIPSIALQGGNGSYMVRVLAGNGTVSARPVEVGLVTASLAEVRSGIQPGDQVVVGTTADRAGGSAGSGLPFPGGGSGFPGGGSGFPGGGSGLPADGAAGFPGGPLP